MADSSSSFSGIDFFGLLTIIFIVLKLTNYIAWSWLWILAPLWIPVTLLLLFVIFAAIIAAALK